MALEKGLIQSVALKTIGEGADTSHDTGERADTIHGTKEHWRKGWYQSWY
jgi:hypothetical protein